MLREETELDDVGNHYKTYRTALETVQFEVEEGGFTIEIELRQDVVGRFSEEWTES